MYKLKYNININHDRELGDSLNSANKMLVNMYIYIYIYIYIPIG